MRNIALDPVTIDNIPRKIRHYMFAYLNVPGGSELEKLALTLKLQCMEKQQKCPVPNSLVPDNLLEMGNVQELNHWLSFYIVETIKKNSEVYPPKILYQLLSGLLQNSDTLNFLDTHTKKQQQPILSFKPLHSVIDNHLRKEGNKTC